jgi:hypothetical protein
VQENTIVNWFRGHHKPKAIFQRHCQRLLKKKLVLVKPVATRFGSQTIVAQRLQRVKAALGATVVDEEFLSQGFIDAPDDADGRVNKGETCRKLIVSNDFCQAVKQHIELTGPVKQFIDFFNQSASTMGKAYHAYFEMGQAIVAINPEVKDLFDHRWAYGHCSIHSAAYMLDPEFIAHKQWRDTTVMDDFMSCMAKVGILLKTRELVEDEQLEVAPGVKYPDADKEWQQKVMAEHVQYRTQQGIFARDIVFESTKKIVAHQWWAQYGSTTPHLQDMEMKILGHQAAATAIERLNSEFSYIHDKKRNSLAHT